MIDRQQGDTGVIRGPVLERFRRLILEWFDSSHRELPWRSDPTLYRVWISEIMLQQTQVATVVDYFERFMRKFPDVRRLAAADESEVLRAWEGLGYYRRAKQLHAAARQIVTEHGGRFPQSFDEVRALPGIGRYTAGAILSIGAAQSHPILEGNTIRLFARLLNFRDDVTTSASLRRLWEFAETLPGNERPGDVNQALMELGSLICQPGPPRCLLCPVSEFCKAYQQGNPESLPNKGHRTTRYETLHQAAIVVARRGRVVLRRCPPGEHWAGLWDFPRFSIGEMAGEPTSLTALQRELRLATGLDARLVPAPLATIRHSVTRFRIRLDCFLGESVTGRLRRKPDWLEWVSPDELEDRPMSVTGRKIARALFSE